MGACGHKLLFIPAVIAMERQNSSGVDFQNFKAVYTQGRILVHSKGG